MNPNTNPLGEEKYRSEISRYMLPAVVIGTMDNSLSGIMENEHRSIHHDFWLVRLGNQLELVNTDFWINFCSVIDVNGGRLNDPKYRADYTLKKIMTLNGLSGTSGEYFSTEDICMQALRRFDWIVRWRLALGLSTNEDLSSKHFEDNFMSALKSGSVLGFVPIFDRLEKLFEDIANNKVELQDLTVIQGARYPNGVSPLNWHRLAERLGVTLHTLSASAAFKIMLVDELSALDDERAIDLAKAIRPGKVAEEELFSKVAVRNYFRTWQSLYRLSVSGAVTWNRLTFDPFRKKSARKFAEQVTDREPDRTSTILPEDFFRLTRAATHWLLENHEYIEYSVNLLREATSSHVGQVPIYRRRILERQLDRKRPPGAPRLYFGWHFTKRAQAAAKGRNISIGYAAKLLMSASMLVIGCYSPRRGGEIGQLRVNCIERSSTGSLMKVYIEKTERGVKSVPVPEAVRFAVEIMERLDWRDPEDPDTHWLFKVRKDEGFIESKVTANIRDFVTYIELEPPSGDEAWDLASHQLRRGHAISLYYGDEWSTIDDTAYSLLHINIWMTHIYTSETVPGEILRLTDELRSRLVIDKQNRSQEYLDWETATKERLREMVEFKQEFDEVRLEAYVYRKRCCHATALASGLMA